MKGYGRDRIQDSHSDCYRPRKAVRRSIVHTFEENPCSEFPPLLVEVHPYPLLCNTGSCSDSTDFIQRTIQRQAATWPRHHVTWLAGVESRVSHWAVPGSRLGVGSQLMIRARSLRGAGNYLSARAVRMRKHYFCNEVTSANRFHVSGSAHLLPVPSG